MRRKNRLRVPPALEPQVPRRRALQMGPRAASPMLSAVAATATASARACPQLVLSVLSFASSERLSPARYLPDAPFARLFGTLQWVLL